MNSFEAAGGWNNLSYCEEVNIVSGEYSGRTGRVVFARKEGNSTRLEVETDDENIFVNLDDVRKTDNCKTIDSLDLRLFVPEEEQQDWDARIDESRRWNEGGTDVVSV